MDLIIEIKIFLDCSAELKKSSLTTLFSSLCSFRCSRDSTVVHGASGCPRSEEDSRKNNCQRLSGRQTCPCRYTQVCAQDTAQSGSLVPKVDWLSWIHHCTVPHMFNIRKHTQDVFGRKAQSCFLLLFKVQRQFMFLYFSNF